LPDGKRSVQELLKEDAEYQSALNNATQVRAKRESLQKIKSEILPADLTKLEKLLPDNIDNIKLIIDMNNIADKHGLILKGAKLDTTKASTDTGKLGADNNKYGTIGITFSVNSSYENFQSFLADLEKSLRLVEITDLSVTGNNNSNLYDFSVGLKTYWLK
jgi:Tfp pilus assembly protein PilO